MPLKLYNTLTRKVEEFNPINPPNVSFYTCGQTVYDYTHIGHLRKYTNDDLLKRALIYNGYKVKHVQNVTDVGHLVSDADEGEDKLEKGAKRTGKTVWEVAKFYENHFYDSLSLMNILPPDTISRATEHIEAQVNLIKQLEKKGMTYQTDEAVYFDVSKFPGYGKLSGQSLSEKKQGVREEVVIDPKKKNPADFALWFKRIGRFKDHQMHWESPWGDGFPGWHIECSAMSMLYLGDQIDIHTGGVDHIPVHHETEIAQSEAATGKRFVNYWVHYEFLLIDNAKMSKSLQNFYTIEDVIKRGFSPLDLRYLFLTAHYRQKLNFTWEALEGAKNSLQNLKGKVVEAHSKPAKNIDEKNKNVFLDTINDDLNIPKALSILWESFKQGVTYNEILDFDRVFGLKLDEAKERKVPKEVLELAKKRDELRKQEKFEESDEIRSQIEKLGFVVEDTPNGTRIR